MARKPTYEELKQRVKKIEKEVTELKRTDEALRESEEKYRTLFETVPVGIGVANMDGKVLAVNDTMCQMTGYSRKEFKKISAADLYKNPEQRAKALKQLQADGSVRNLEVELKRKDGTTYHALKSITPFTLDGEPVLLTVNEDITTRKATEQALKKVHKNLQLRVEERTAELVKANEQLKEEMEDRKHAEEALRESQKIYSTLVENSLTGIYIDQGTKIVFANKRFAEIYGYSRQKLIGIESWKLVHPDDRALTDEIRTKRLKGEEAPTEYEARGLTKNGETIWILRRNTRIEYNGRRAILGNISDITSRKRLEDQLHQAQKMEAIGTLAGGIAHDFNNVLMGIQGHASLALLHIDSNHPHFEHLRRIEGLVENAAVLTKQLLGFARGGKYEIKPTNLNDITQKSSELFGRTKKEIRIHRKYQKGPWPVEIDRGQIEHVLFNLYINAWQAMPHGGDLYIETNNVVLDEKDTKPFDVKPGNYVKVSVTDTGVGMDEATQQRIFDPFFTTKEIGRGTGLGLSSAYGIIKNHAGIINVYSEKGRGTTFNVYLPASEKEVRIEEKKLADEVLKGTETVLLVDDEDSVLDVGKEMLKEMGYKVLSARSGKKAVEVYAKHKDQIDLVILDMIMPDMGGGEAYDRMKDDNPGIKVLLSSGYSIDGQASEILERGCDGFIQKPFSMKELSGKIREVLEKK